MMRSRELGSSAKPAPFRVKTFLQLLVSLFEHSRAEFCSDGLHPVVFLEGPPYLCAALEDLFPVGLPEVGDAGEEVNKTGLAHPACLGKIGSGKEWVSFRGHEDRKRPAPLPGKGLAYGHVDLVDVRTLLPVHLDGDEGLIQQLGHFSIFKGFVSHYMAPMAGGTADGAESTCLPLPGFTKGFFVPGIPGYGVVGMLQKVGTFFVDKVIIRPAAFLMGMRHEALLLPVCLP